MADALAEWTCGLGSRGFPSAARVGGADGGGDRGGGRHRPAQLARRGLFCGAQAIAWELEALQVAPIPALRTINRILERHALHTKRVGPYVRKGTPYPTLSADQPGMRHQMDFVGPCYLTGPVRFYSLHSVDLAPGRCAIEPVLGRSSQITLEAVWAMWRRLGIPQHQQVDNDMVFYGSRTYPRGMGPLIRLCLAHDVEPWFIPPAEPWRNGVVERFNACWQQHGPSAASAAHFSSAAARGSRLRTAAQRLPSLQQTRRPNARCRPRGCQCTAGISRSRVVPHHPLAKPERGRYHLIRLIRRDGRLDVFGERFRVPAAAVHTYVRATIDVTHQQLLVYWMDRSLMNIRIGCDKPRLWKLPEPWKQRPFPPLLKKRTTRVSHSSHRHCQRCPGT